MKTTLTLGLAALLVLSSAHTGPGLQLGDKAPDFSLENVDGTTVSLSGMTDVKGVVVVFTCNHCPYAKLYEQRIIDMDKALRPQGWPVVAIQPNDTEVYPSDNMEAMKERAKEKGYTFPYLLDASQATAKAFGAARTPEVYLLEREEDGFYLRYTGAIDNNVQNEDKPTTHYVKQAIEELEAGQAVSETKVAAVGCGIKYKS